MKYCLLLLLVFSSSICIGQHERSKEELKRIAQDKKSVFNMKGTKFPDFSLTTLDGETISSENTKGKIVLFNFWFTTCKPCIIEMPELNEMVKELESEDVVFVAPSLSTTAEIEKFLKRFAFDYQIVPDVKDFIYGYDIHSFPTHFVIDQEGVIDKVLIGYSTMTVGALKRATKKLLK